MSGLLAFGPFLLSLSEHTLWKQGALLPLRPLEYDLLVVLVEHAPKVVNSAELCSRVWKNDRVEPSAVRTAVSRLRNKLGEGPNGFYLLKKSYCLALDVRPVEPVADTPAVAQPVEIAYVAALAPPQDRPAVAPVGTGRPGSTAWLLLRRVAIALLLILTASGLLLWLGNRPLPRVDSVVALTSDGLRKDGPLVTDGSRIYFREKRGEQWMSVSMPVTGGGITPMEVPGVMLPYVLDASPGGELLIHGLNSHREPYFWRRRPGQAVTPFVGGARDSAGTSESGIVYASHQDHTLRIITSEAVSVLGSFQGWPYFPRWSPRRRELRFSVMDPETEVPCLWSVRGLSGKAEPLENFPPGSCCGTWSSDGNTFVFTAGSENKHDLWAEVERRPSFLGKQAPRPVRLTAGPLDYQSAVLDATRDGVIYAVGKSTEAKVLRFDRDSQKFEPYLGGLKGFELDYSRDGKWIAYISYPERALWKLRTDGSDRMQLTFPPINPIEPHWSPDGSRIAFMGQATGKPRRLFMIGADGGAPVEVTTYPSDQGVPTWHRDGKMIAFGDVRKGQPPLSMTIHVLDLSENRTSEIAGSNGLWSPRWSPDGRYIAATSEDSRKLLVFDRQNSAWRTLAVFASLDNLTWTRDGAYIYFRAATLRGERAPGLLDYAIYRIRTTGLELERLIALTGLHGTFPEWIGLAPDGSPLVAEDRFSEEIYSLKIVK